MRTQSLRITDFQPRPTLTLWRGPEDDVESRAEPSAGRIILWTTVIPLAVLLVLTAMFHWTAVDVNVSRLFYGRPHDAWPRQNAEPWMALYHYGPFPGLLLGCGGAGLALVSLLWERWKPWRSTGLFLAAALALGPGLIVNGIVKPQWGRPRPAQIRAFGGDKEFVGVWGFGAPGVSKSFPSGHASMGFYLMAPAFLLYPRRPRWATAFLISGLLGGGLLGLARIAQGQHFLSDVIWSGGLVYFSCLLVGCLIRQLPAGEVESPEAAAEPVILRWDGRHDAETEETHDDSRTEPRIRRRAA
jgi:membrane-associated PAP2 superfamily phosphatase